MSMFFCQRARVVSSTGEAEAMPAFEMQISTPPNFHELSRKLAATASSRVTSIQELATTSLPYFFLRSVSAPASASRSMSQMTTQAPSSMRRRAVASPMPPAPPVIRATRPASGLGRHALQLGLFEQPVLDVEGFLFGKAAVGGHAGRAAHHVDGVDVEFAGNAGRGLVGRKGDHAHAGHEI